MSLPDHRQTEEQDIPPGGGKEWNCGGISKIWPSLTPRDPLARTPKGGGGREREREKGKKGRRDKLYSNVPLNTARNEKLASRAGGAEWVEKVCHSRERKQEQTHREPQVFAGKRPHFPGSRGRNQEERVGVGYSPKQKGETRNRPAGGFPD